MAEQADVNLRLELARAILSLPADLRADVARAALDALGSYSVSVDPNVMPLSKFIREVWRIVEPETPFLESFVVDAIAEHLEAVARLEIRRLVICIPRRLGKSILCSVIYPAWLFSVDPSIRLICASYSLQFVKRDAVKTRDLIRSNWYRTRYGEKVQIKVDQEQAHWFYTTRGGFRLATSPGSIGVGEGADIQIVDDPHKPQDVNSPQKRQFVIDWWENTMASSARDPNSLRRIVVQQRLHPSDLAGVCIAKGYEALILPMEYDGVKRSTSLGVYDKRTQKGELLWPARYSEEDIALLKEELGARGYQAQYQQAPRGEESRMFKEEKWRFWSAADESVIDVVRLKDGTECEMVPLPADFDSYVMSWDVAVSAHSHADYSVGQVWAMRGSEFYLLDQVRFRGNIQTFIENFDKLCDRWPFVVIKLIEYSTASAVLIELLKGRYDGVTAVPVSSDKAVRAEVVSNVQLSGLIFLPNPATKSWVYDFIDEFSDFPPESGSGHDDQVDAASQAILYLKRRRPLAFA